MASELTFGLSLSYAKDGVTENISLSKISDITTGAKLALTQTVGTAEEAVSLVDINPVKLFVVQNLDQTNYVQAGVVTAQYAGRLTPSAPFMLLPPDAQALFLKANTAACKVAIWAVNG